MLKRLLATMGAAREDARELGRPTPALTMRRALISQAMLPADATSAWRDYRAVESDNFAAALADVVALEAPDERLEALTLALFMRETLETPGRTAALVTPDRHIARRVAVELRRFNIEIDDSGGKPLATTPIGALARLVAAIGANGAGAANVAALLAHPLTRLGLTRAHIASLAPLVEIGVLRVLGSVNGGWAARVVAARELARAPHAHPAARRIGDDDWRAIENLLARFDAAFAPFANLPAEASLSDRASTHRAALEAVTAGDDEIGDEGAATLFELLEQIGARRSAIGIRRVELCGAFRSHRFRDDAARSATRASAAQNSRTPGGASY